MKGVLFHQDNAPTHKSVVAMAAVRDCGFELVDRPPYSCDLTPSDFFCYLAGKQLTIHSAVARQRCTPVYL